MVIEKGLEPGETVVTEGQLRLAPGSRVVVRDGGWRRRRLRRRQSAAAAQEASRRAKGEPPAPRTAAALCRGESGGNEGLGMNISEIFIRRPIATSLLMAGDRAVRRDRLPRAAGQRPAAGGLSRRSTVSASLPGANPDTMASSVATPLERQFTTIAGLDSMISSSGHGQHQHHPAVRPEPRHRRRRRWTWRPPSPRPCRCCRRACRRRLRSAR